MEPVPAYPALYQVNTRVWLTERSRALGRPATLDDVPDADLDRVADLGFDWVWLLSVWRTGQAGQRASRENAEWRKEFHATLPDLSEDDIAGSGFAITGYSVHPSLGGIRRWPGCATGSGSAVFGSCSTSSRITPRWTTRGSRATPSTTCLEPSSTWPGRRRTIPG